MNKENKESNLVAREPIYFSYMIRLVSFFAVVLFHFNMAIVQFFPNSMLLGKLSYLNQSVGDIAISLFIITSGFSLEMSTRGKFSLKKYLAKRAISIYPAFWICYLLVGMFLFLFSGHLTGDGHHSKFILSLIGLDGFFLYRMENYYLVGEWYTGYMLLTYLLFPFLLIGIRLNAAITSIIVLTIFSVLYVNYDSIFKVYINCNPIMRLPDFMFGMLFSKFIYSNKNKFYASGLLSILIISVLVIFLKNIPSQLYMLIFGCSLYSMLAMLFNLFRNIKVLVTPVTYLANLTFTAFLLHHQIIYFLFGKLDYSQMTHVEAFYFYFSICFLSLTLSYILKTPIKFLEDFMKSMLLKKNAI